MFNKIISFESKAYRKYFKPSKRLQEAQEVFAQSLSKAVRAKLKEVGNDKEARARVHHQARELSLVFTMIAQEANKSKKSFRMLGEKLQNDDTLIKALLDARFADRKTLLEGVVQALVTEIYYYPLFEHWASFSDEQKDSLVENLAQVGYQLAEYFHALGIKNGLIVDKMRKADNAKGVVDPQAFSIEELRKDRTLVDIASKRLTLCGGEYATFAYIDVVGGLATRMGPEVQVVWNKDKPGEGKVFFASTFFNDDTKNIMDRSADMHEFLLSADKLKQDPDSKALISGLKADKKKEHLLDLSGGAYAVDIKHFEQFKDLLSHFNTLSDFHLWALQNIASRIAHEAGKDQSIAYPKGAYGLGEASEPYFEIKAWGIRELEQRLGKKVPYVLVTSPDNDQQTRDFWAAHNYFGLDKDQIVFYSQEDVFPQVYSEVNPVTKKEEYFPFFNKEGRTVLKAKGHYVSKEIVECLQQYKNKWWPDLKKVAQQEGVENELDLVPVINFNIENLAANYNGLKEDFFLPMIGKMIVESADVIAITADIMEGPTEKAGRIVGLQGKDGVVNRNVEYNDPRFKDVKKYEYKDENGSPVYFVKGTQAGRTVVMVLTPEEVTAHLNKSAGKTAIEWEKPNDYRTLDIPGFDAGSLVFSSKYDVEKNLIAKDAQFSLVKGLAAQAMTEDDLHNYTITYNYANTNIFLSTAGYLEREYNESERFYKDSTKDSAVPVYGNKDKQVEPFKLEGGYFNILDGAVTGKSLVVKFKPEEFFLASKERWHVEEVLKNITPYFYKQFGAESKFELMDGAKPEDVRIMISPLFASGEQELKNKIKGKIKLGKGSSIVLNFSGDVAIDGDIIVAPYQSLVIQDASGYKKGDEPGALRSSANILVKQNGVWNDTKVLTIGAGKELYFSASDADTNTYELRKSQHAIRSSKSFPVSENDFKELVADMRIVVLDDEPQFLEKIEKQLLALGVTKSNIQLYEDPDEFLKKLEPENRLNLTGNKKRKPNLVISDFAMGDTAPNGLQVFNKLHEREENKNVQFLIVTGTAEEFQNRTGLELGKAIYNPHFGWLAKNVVEDADNDVFRDILEGSLIP